MKIKSACNYIFKDKYFQNRYGNVMLIYAFLLVLIVAASLFDENFLTVGNFKNLLLTSFPLLMVAFAQGMIIFTGGIDLSLGCLLYTSPGNETGWQRCRSVSFVFI